MTDSQSQSTGPFVNLPRAARVSAMSYQKEMILKDAIQDLQKGLFCRGTWFKDGGSHDLDFLFTESEARVKVSLPNPSGGYLVEEQWTSIPSIMDWNLLEAGEMLKCAEGAIAFATAWNGFGKPVFEQVKDLVNEQLVTFPHEDYQMVTDSRMEGNTRINFRRPKCQRSLDVRDENGKLMYEEIEPGSIYDPESPTYDPYAYKPRVQKITADLAAHNDQCLAYTEHERDPDDLPDDSEDSDVSYEGDAAVLTTDDQAIDNLVQLFAATIRDQLGNETYEPPARQSQLDPVNVDLEPAVSETEALGQSYTESDAD